MGWSSWMEFASFEAFDLVANHVRLDRDTLAEKLTKNDRILIERLGEAPRSETLDAIKQEEDRRRKSCGTPILSIDERWQIGAEFSHLGNEVIKKLVGKRKE